MALYEQRVGDHVATRVQPEPGSDLETHLAALADAGTDNWVRVTEPEPDGGEGGDEPKRPAKADNKAAWVDWAVTCGADRAEAEASTKDELITAYGG